MLTDLVLTRRFRDHMTAMILSGRSVRTVAVLHTGHVSHRAGLRRVRLRLHLVRMRVHRLGFADEFATSRRTRKHQQKDCQYSSGDRSHLHALLLETNFFANFDGKANNLSCSTDAGRTYRTVGLDVVEGYLAKGFPTWIESGLPIARTTQLSTQETHDRASSVKVVDVRSDQEWNAGHIAGAKHIMLGDLNKRRNELQRNQPLHIACGSGYRSSIAASLLQHAGFADVSSMAGGMMAWTARHLPVVSG